MQLSRFNSTSIAKYVVGVDLLFVAAGAQWRYTLRHIILFREVTF